MGPSDLIRASMKNWQFAPPGAEDATIQKLIATAGIALPPEYVEYLRVVNGSVGDLAVN